jgi:hypothetical protein
MPRYHVDHTRSMFLHQCVVNSTPLLVNVLSRRGNDSKLGQLAQVTNLKRSLHMMLWAYTERRDTIMFTSDLRRRL